MTRSKAFDHERDEVRITSVTHQLDAKGGRLHRRTWFDVGGVRRQTTSKPSRHVKRVLPIITVVSPSRKVARDALRIAGLSKDDVETLSKEIEI